MTIPLFKSQYSIGKSILTLDEKWTDAGPKSIIDIAERNGLKEVFLVDDSLSGMFKATTRFPKHDIKLRFGFRVHAISEAGYNDESDDVGKHESKVIIFALNEEGRKQLIKLSTIAFTEGLRIEKYTKSQVARIKYDTLKENWSDNLKLAIPFYDSFIYKNLLTIASIVPEFGFTKPIFFVEENGLPFDIDLKLAVEEYVRDEFDIFGAKSIYYENKEDFVAWQTMKCIAHRTELQKPNLPFCCSRRFCFEAWKEENNG